MRRARRRSRAVYRVYGEEEYLAGADALDVLDVHDVHEGLSQAVEPSSGRVEPSSGRGLRRIACATALTGTVGVVGLAALRTHTWRTHTHGLDRGDVARRIAQSNRAAMSAAGPGTSSSAVRGRGISSSAVRGRGISSSAVRGRGISSSAIPGRSTSSSADRGRSPHRTLSRRAREHRADRFASTGSVSFASAPSAVSREPIEAAGSSPQVAQAPAADPRPAAQSEFGFER